MANSATAIETASGNFFDVLNPDVADISVNDICWALSRKARFGGHSRGKHIWTVAEHSMFTADLVTLALQGNVHLSESLIWYMLKQEDFREHDWKYIRNDVLNDLYLPKVTARALAHDFSEAYLEDLPKPVKSIPELKKVYSALEERVQEKILQALGLTLTGELERNIDHVVKWADLAALAIEAHHLMHSRGKDWLGWLPDLDWAVFELFPGASGNHVQIFGDLRARLHQANVL